MDETNIGSNIIDIKAEILHTGILISSSELINSDNNTSKFIALDIKNGQNYWNKKANDAFHINF